MPCLLQAHALPVTGVASLWESPTTLVLVSIAGDSRVCIWGCSVGSNSAAAWLAADWRLQQELEADAPVQHALALSSIPQQHGW